MPDPYSLCLKSRTTPSEKQYSSGISLAPGASGRMCFTASMWVPAWSLWMIV
jgi:hypothetical protein